jgi:RNA polymerase-binding transcription factor DksA
MSLKSRRQRITGDMRVVQMDDALGRISLGLYPVCESCGERIEADRLRADPAEKLCWSCAARKSRSTAHPRS